MDWIMDLQKNVLLVIGIIEDFFIAWCLFVCFFMELIFDRNFTPKGNIAGNAAKKDDKKYDLSVNI